MRPPKALVDAVIASLEKGEGWTFNEFVAEHYGSGIEVWIANGHYGVHLKTPDIKYGSDINLFGFLVPWRRRLFKAARSAAATGTTSRLSAYCRQLGVA